MTSARSGRLLLGLPLLALLLLGLALPAAAHDVTLGQSKIVQRGLTVDYELALEHDQLVRRLDVPPSAAAAEQTDPERLAELTASRTELAAFLDRGLRVLLDGDRCSSRLGPLAVEEFRGSSYALLEISYRCAGDPSGAFDVEYDLFLEDAAGADHASHANVVDYELGGETGRTVFEPGAQRLSTGARSEQSSTGGFLLLGLEHVLAGPDHLLFVVALLLGATSVRNVVHVVMAFTAAHSVSLALTATGWLAVPAALVEPLIALSIVGVAVQNLVQRKPRHRVPIVLGFGLLHGLGFGAALSFGETTGWSTVVSLLAFNVGIEVGQALVIAIAVPVLLLARRRQWSAQVRWAASGLIASCGALWFVDRLIG